MCPEGSSGAPTAVAPAIFDLKWVLNALLSPANPVIVGLFDAAGNRMPAMDVAARPGFVDPIDRAARLLGIVYGNAAQLQQFAPADALVNPTNLLGVGAFPHIWNNAAATWNRWREGSRIGVPQVEVIIRDEAGNYFAKIDAQGYLVTMHVEHHKVHDGDFYTVSDFDNNVQMAAPKYWHIITPDTAARFHLKIAVESDTGCLLEFFENPTTTNNGVALPAFNNDRNSGNATTFLFFRDPVVTLDGTRLQVARVGAGREKKIGGTARSEAEWILAQNEQYLVKVTVDANGADVTINCEGYEP